MASGGRWLASTVRIGATVFYLPTTANWWRWRTGGRSPGMFPFTLTESELILISLGACQIKQARSYYGFVKCYLRMIVLGAVRQRDELAVVNANGSLDLRTQHSGSL
ncbi:hypothetical protein EVAR_7063_1 [Eumeta japonica]|uniref:Uncharacterized protein n=1 Tax=Eumeta variegata TaxID=151549 RepID=A0A4C1XAG3_EUMVA|nr:hypothetical protein EVAR_7063_1 [Eumeta japonica]